MELKKAIQALMNEHGTEEVTKAVFDYLEGSRGFDIGEAICMLFSSYMFDAEMEFAANELKQYGYFPIKIESLAERVKVEEFAAGISENPYQLSLI